MDVITYPCWATGEWVAWIYGANPPDTILAFFVWALNNIMHQIVPKLSFVYWFHWMPTVYGTAWVLFHVDYIQPENGTFVVYAK